MHKGFFLSIEGPDGSGKSTISKKLLNYLEIKKIDCILTREPGGYQNDICEKIRQILLESRNMSYKTEALLFAASRCEHVDNLIIPSLEDNKFVICDRYIDSSLSYQGFGRGLGIKNIYDINMFAINQLLPHLTIFIMIDPKIGIERIFSQRKEELNRLDKESLKFHEQTYKGYLEIANLYKERIIIVDGNESIDQIFKNIILAINNKLKKGEFFINEI